VSLTAPTNGQVFTAPANITLTATASDTDGTISKVQFFQGATLLNEDLTAPYSFNWNNVAAGSYSLTAKAFDNLGGTTTSAAVSITVNALPSVSLTAPTNGQVFTAPANITLTATASDTDGSISKVEFFAGASLLGEDTTGPYSYAWTNVAAGNYVLTARATDNSGAISTSSAVNITVTTPNQPPVASPGGSYSGNSGTLIQFNGSGSSDSDGTITNYQWNFGDGTSGSGLAPLHAYASPGTYAATLTVTDNGGATTTANTSAVITSPSNQPPIAHPGGPYSAVSGTPIQFNGTSSSDPDGTITHYQWNFADGTGSGASPSHIFTSSGSHLVTLTVTDNGGATNSRSINLDVREPGQEGGSAPLESPVIGDVNWDPSNRDSMDNPNNRRGNVANTTTGNKNFQVVAPVVALPGRGSQLSLNLVYNSQVWTQSGNEILFDIDHDWPAPGWHLGFGKMVMMGTAGAMIIEPDGTRHPFTGTVFDHTYPPAPPFRPFPVTVMAFKGHTTDGSNIEYRSEGNVGLARYPDGTIVKYSYYTGTVPVTYIYPYQIIDANGNIINISYIPNCNPIPDPTTEPRIQRIVDSVGRVITFNYDSQQRLTSISGPGLPDANGNATTQTLVRIHYKTQALDLTDAFTGLAARTKSTSLSVIDAIYYPATGRGYWFGGDSYSSYGMLRRVIEERGMNFSPGASPNEQGTISEGTITRQQVYNYPSAPVGLNGVPSFTEMTESWDGGPVNAPITEFSLVENSGVNERTITVTHPDGTKSIQKSFNFTNAPNSDPDKWKNGTTKEQQTTNSAGHLLSKTVFEWEKGPDDAPRLLRTTTTDDVGQVLKTEYDEYGPDNSVGRIRDYDYDGSTVIRTTRNTFKSYLDNDLNQGISSQLQAYPLFHPRLVNLITSVSVFEGDNSANKLAAFTEYKYDEYAAPLKSYTPDYLNSSDLFACGEPRQSGGISGILNHAGAFNPMPANSQNGGGLGDQYFTRRGNVTSVLRYADTSNSSSPANPITESRTYDMAGNVIAASRSCCDQTSSVFELATQYAFAVSQTRGSSDPNSLARVTTSAQYDLSTGLPKTRTDENGRPTTLTYYPASLRPKEILHATGAVTSFEYDDAAAKVTQTSRLSANGAIANQTIKYLNGLGQVIREEAVGPDNTVDVVQTVFDNFGRLKMQTRPYRSGSSVDDLIWSETTYDSFGRMIKVREDSTHEIAGDPGTETHYAYNETPRPSGASSNPGQTTKITDPWGRWRWSRVDASGRPVEVVEQNPAGGTNFQTTYTYDTLGNLVRVNQGEQVRRFKYDSLGRQTQQKMAEATATLNSAGERATSEPDNERWSDVFTYDSRSNVTSHTDARGVRTVFSYQVAGQDDPLNRLQSVSYDTSRVDGSLTVLSSPTVSYQYRTKSSPASLIDVTQIKQIIAADVATEDFDYDAEGRIFEKRFTFANRPMPMTTTYGYDNLGRVNQITYPEQYQPSGSAVRKVIAPSYEAGGRISGLQVNGTHYASQITYNPASQITDLVIGSGFNQLMESYSYEPSSGLLSGQTVQRAGTTLMNLSYSYQQSAECDNGDMYPDPEIPPPTPSSARTGQVTRIHNVLTGKSQNFSYDTLGRLRHVVQGRCEGEAPGVEFQSDWRQTYAYDRYGNRSTVTALGANDSPNGLSDGHPSLAYDPASNRITNGGFSYDAAGNQLTNGTGQTFVYDAAGRLAKVKDQTGVTSATYTYGASNRRLITQTGNESSPNKTYYIWDGDSVIAEYTDPSGAPMPQWSKNSIYLGTRLLATEEPNGSGGEIVRYHHPDRLGTRLITNNVDSTYFQQVNLPFGTALDAESTPGASPTTRRFTSYDRSSTTGLDYAVNRQYDPRQGRFTQPDPLGMGAASLADPQSLNMYSYVGNDPVNRVDPDGQFWGALFRFIGGLFRGLRPNVINGSFAYGNHPPITVSFTTNFQNISAGFGGLNFLVRDSGVWVTDAVRRSKKNLCDFLVSKMWDLFKHHNNEVGSEFRGDRRGRDITNCYMYAEKVLMYAYSQIGRPDVVARIKQGWKDPDGKGQFGPGLAKYLVSLGWSTYYWNPDVKNPSDGMQYHKDEWRILQKGGTYYGIGVDRYVVDYRLGKNRAAYDELMDFRFGFGLARGGVHNYLYSTGQILEVHWKNEGPDDLYGHSYFHNWSWQSGLILVPPDCKVAN
jgi:RHS repeat-associated protein